MEFESNRTPVTVVLIGKAELLTVAFATGAIVAVAYQMGKQAQRNWMLKMVKDAKESLVKE